VSEVVSEQEVNLDKLEGLFKGAFLRTEREKDELVIRDESGVKTFVKIDEGKKMITFYSVWRLKEQFPEAAHLKFANGLNNGLILVRFSVPIPNILWCDYQFFYEGGIMPYQIVHNYKRFVSVCIGAVQSDTSGMFA
jgi:hypothetical protein